MTFRIAEARKELQAFNLKRLFIEQMGWDHPGADITIRFNGQSLKLKGIAQKRGLGAFSVPPIDGKIPDYATRRKIETEVRKIIAEHVLIFTNQDESVLRWQWVRREHGKPTTAREYEYSKGKNGDALLQRLEKMYFSLEDEETLEGITDATRRVRSAFDLEKVTKKFYERFKDEHADFLKFIKGIPDKEMQRHYVSVTLNRLMFVYFIQAKGFLNADTAYLQNHLTESKKKGKDLFYTEFLCPLFFDGFAKKRHSTETKKLLGNIPYLNGGIFEQHQIEELHGEKIQIPDKAFEQLFTFFDEYRWHLDERPNKGDNEINPDVLGYIFEKYINQKQMGAYYTKEDITEYISKNTIIPHLFDVAQKECKVAFEGAGSIWRHLQTEPDRYIYTAARYGTENDLPKEIALGESDPKRREGWNKPASEGFALPTEIWREVVARRRRYQEVKEKLSKGEVTSINDLITLNLDIRQFAQDVIQDSDADLLLAFWKAISQIKVLDPTVGSGAFLFAALNVLEPLYEACVERMSLLVEELDSSGEKHSPKKYEPFRKVLEQVRQRPDEDYFIFKSIIINNLYGVDIMEEAVEICKLRLFLKLASQVEPDALQENLGIEPLPDIDFNIRAGNTLVGFATREDVERSVNMGITGGKEKVQAPKLMALDEDKSQLKRIEEKAEDVDRLYKLFRQQQTEYGGEVRPEDKRELQKRLGELEKELNILLARQYAIHNPKDEAYQKWLESHTPFHWFVEFSGIMNEGGFDVIIGNPPYVEYSKINDYTIQNYLTERTNNLFAFVAERSSTIASKNSRIGLILPNSSISAEKMLPLRKLLLTKYHCWVSSFAWRPSKLFEGANMLLAIWLGQVDSSNNHFTTRYYRWTKEYRDALFDTVSYQSTPIELIKERLPKLPDSIALDVLSRCEKRAQGKSLLYLLEGNTGQNTLYYFRAVLYWFKVLREPPIMKEDGKKTQTGEMKKITFNNLTERDVAFAVMASNLYIFYYTIWSSCQVVNSIDFKFPVDIKDLTKEFGKELQKLANDLAEDVQKNSIIQRRQYSTRGRNYTMDKQYFYIKKSKQIIDKIDLVLAKHFHLTDEEIDYIINYDVKYRLGAEDEEDDE